MPYRFILFSCINKLLAIRATNVDSQTSNYDNWYGVEDGKLSARLTSPSCCWQLQPAPTNAIQSARNIDSIIKTKYFSIDGIRANTPTKKGIYIRQDQHADGSVKQVKTVVE